MSDGLNNEKDHRHARYLFSGDIIDNEELTTACRRLGISEPFESFLKKLNKEMLSSTPQHQPNQQQQQQQPQQQQHKHQQQHQNKQQQQYQSAGAGAGDRKKDCSHTKKYSHSHTKSVNPFEITNNNSNNNNNYTKSGDCTYGQESWGRDSGARDLSPEPHRIPASNSGTDCQMAENESGTTSMIHLATKVKLIIIQIIFILRFYIIVNY